jgi:hypothetical protein
LADKARFSVKKAKEDEVAFRDENGKHRNEVFRLIMEIHAADRCPDSQVLLYLQRFSKSL